MEKFTTYELVLAATKEFTCISKINVQIYVVVSFDEMKIQSNLVFDKHSNELIGFVDLSDEVSNAAAFDEPTANATHVLPFMVRGIASDLKYILEYFSTGNLTSYQIMPVFWKAVSILELPCNLWVCAAVSEGAYPNQKFYDLHIGLIGADYTDDVIHKIVNLFAPSRFTYLKNIFSVVFKYFTGGAVLYRIRQFFKNSDNIYVMLNCYLMYFPRIKQKFRLFCGYMLEIEQILQTLSQSWRLYLHNIV